MLLFVILQIQNPDFESWSYISSNVPFAWDTLKNQNASCSWEIDQNNYRLGNKSIKITINQTSTGYDCAIAQAKGVSPNTTYNISAWIYDNDPRISARLYIACYDNNQNQVDWSFIGSSSTDSLNWQQISGSYTTLNNCSYLDVQIRVYDEGSVGGSINVDGVSLTTGTAPSELRESFNTYPPSQWLELDLGNVSGGFLQKRTSACPFSSDSDCFGIKYRQSDADSSISGLSYLMTDTLDFSSIQPETLIFYYRTSNTTDNIRAMDSIQIEISSDLGNNWNRIWKWNGNLTTTAQQVIVPLDNYNGFEQVLLRIAFYKNSSNGSGSSATGNRYFNIDSFIVKNSYVSRFNRITNNSFETWLYSNVDMMPDYWRKWNNTAPEDNGRSAQLWIKRDTFRFSGNYSVKAFFTTILNPFIEQKFSNPFNSCAGYPISQVDSFVAVSSIRFFDNDSKGKARTGIVWYYGNQSQSDYPANYTTDQNIWQLYENRAKFLGPNQGGFNFDSIAFRIRFYNQGAFPYAEDGATIWADSLNFKLYCYVGNLTPVDVVEFQFNDYISYIRTNNFGIEISPKKPIRISIYSVDGRKIYELFTDKRVFMNLKKGLYVLMISYDKKVILRKKIVL
ncbi:MAG: carbohydrate binding domain-containing protein [candidate division WOR-3 bacterium]|jgi:hypothetical protein